MIGTGKSTIILPLGWNDVSIILHICFIEYALGIQSIGAYFLYGDGFQFFVWFALLWFAFIFIFWVVHAKFDNVQAYFLLVLPTLFQLLNFIILNLHVNFVVGEVSYPDGDDTNDNW